MIVCVIQLMIACRNDIVNEENISENSGLVFISSAKNKINLFFLSFAFRRCTIFKLVFSNQFCREREREKNNCNLICTQSCEEVNTFFPHVKDKLSDSNLIQL